MDGELAGALAKVFVQAEPGEGWVRLRDRVAAVFGGAAARDKLDAGRDLWGRASREAAETGFTMWLENRLKEKPDAAPELRALLEEFDEHSSAVHHAVSGGTSGTVVQAGSVGSLTVHTPPPANDHLDFRESTFHGQVVGVQHNHYVPPGGGLPDPDSWPTLREADPIALGDRQAAGILADLFGYWAGHWPNRASQPPPDTVKE